MSAYLLGIDIGTSACKAALFDENGQVKAQALTEYAVEYPQKGYAEQSPDVWWQAVCSAVKAVIEKSGVSPAKIAGVGVDGQSWSAIPVDRGGNVLCSTPIWTDTRAQAECEDILKEASEDELFALCGNPVKPSYTFPKILWYKHNLPEVYKRASVILQSNGFIVYRLTGRYSQDMSQGYGLCCFDINNLRWDTDVCRRLGVWEALLPPLCYSHEIVGRVTGEAARMTGLCEGTPVVAGGLDAACGTLGAGVIAPGQTQEQGGQAGGMSICLDRPVADKSLILGCHVVKDRWLLQGGTTGGGGALKWLREQVCPELSFERMSELAGRVPAGSEGVLFLPYMAGERSPLWNPEACGVFFGLNYAKTRAHLIRAVMEGVAYSLKHNLEVAKAAGAASGTLRAMGGSSNSLVWTQIKSDVTGREIEVPDGENATTLGAALLAGVGTGLYGSFDEATSKTVAVRRAHKPNGENEALYDQRYADYLELSERLAPMMRKTEGQA